MPFTMLNETEFNNLIEIESESYATVSHWSDEYGSAVRASIFIIELLEWIFLLICVIGMYIGIEIGHPSKKKYIQCILLQMLHGVFFKRAILHLQEESDFYLWNTCLKQFYLYYIFAQ